MKDDPNDLDDGSDDGIARFASLDDYLAAQDDTPPPGPKDPPDAGGDGNDETPPASTPPGLDEPAPDSTMAMLAQTLQSIDKRLQDLEHRKEAAPSLESITPEEFDKLQKEKPLEATKLVMAHLLRDMGYGKIDPNAIAGDVAQQLTHNEQVEEFREAISNEFNPAGNPELHKAASKIYADRKRAGISLANDPSAEYVAWTLAARRHPDLVKNVQRGHAPRARDVGTPGDSGKRGSTGLSAQDRAVAARWGIDLTKPKEVARLRRNLDTYKNRRRP